MCHPIKAIDDAIAAVKTDIEGWPLPSRQRVELYAVLGDLASVRKRVVHVYKITADDVFGLGLK